MEKIKANELRIGNLHEGVDISHPRMGKYSVKVDGKAFNTITAYGIHMVEQGTMEFKPLPLTTTWLDLFGFTNGSSGMPACWWKGTNELLSQPDTDKQVFNYWERNANFPIQIKYVHQLQNLYFALTGKELEYSKLEKTA